MRVFLSALSFHPDFGGPARSVSQLAESLQEAGLEVGLWAPDNSAMTSPLVQHMSSVQRLDGTAEEAWQAFGPLDILHDNGIWRRQHRQLARLAISAGVAKVVSTRGMLEPWALKHKRTKKLFAWSVYQRRDLQKATFLHATASSEANQLIKLGLGSPIEIIPNAVKIPSSNYVEGLKSRQEDCRTCLFMSRIHPVKGLPLLLKAWAQVRPAGWKLDIVGPDENNHQAELGSLSEHLNIADVVRFVGALEGSEKEAALAKAELAVLPTYSENFGIFVAEALSYGCPVITTHGAPWKSLEIERCGWWTEITVEDIASALKQATSLPTSELRSMGARGRGLAQRKFSWPANTQKFINLYKKVLNLERDT